MLDDTFPVVVPLRNDPPEAGQGFTRCSASRPGSWLVGVDAALNQRDESILLRQTSAPAADAMGAAGL